MKVDGSQRKTAKLNGLNFSYLEWGAESSPPMIMLQGIQSHAHSWDVFANALQDEHRILAMDQRGHGDTDWPDPPFYTTDLFADDVLALAQHLGINRFVLVGLSMGAHVALAFSIKHPEFVEKLVSVDVPASLSLLYDPKVRERLVNVQREFASLDEMVEDARDTYPFASDEMIRHRMEHNAYQLSSGRLTLKYSPDAPRRWNPDDLSEDIARIQCPTLIVRGGDSEVLSIDQAQAMSDAIPNGQLTTIPGAGHSVPMDKPAEFEAAVRAFLAQ
jgi:pimeloyl-ACP methyl ester carboxylesterase